MLSSVFAKAVRDRGVGIVLLTAVLVFFSGFAMAIYGDFDETTLDFYNDMPEGLRALYGDSDGSAAGIVTGAIFGLLGPMLVLVSAVSGAADASVGEERGQSLGLLLANPVSRRGVLLSKTAVMLIGVVVICVVLGVGSALLSDLVGLDLGDLDVVAASIQLIGLAWMFGALALVVGAASGSRAGSAIAGGLAAVSYLVTSLFPVEPGLEPLAKWTPWYLYSGGQPLSNGVDWPKLAVMVGVAAALIGASVPLYDRRDIRA